ncbi:PadR family transcriptional regulator [Evansella tamaricis]|uniref:PadR family transcriptional regulator n=1 Tax=Evansella tamaricis TaxID=2069301 RepID=A0ABS6JLP3_9BACI|nr:PadR family transcriptional regulator [Evansella tamaricis]MBU9714595.1 PadR family transcriptional regulator [Evansella tamaricis]
MEVEKVLKTYIPMTETAYYILLSLNEPRHGYGIVKHVGKITGNRIQLGSGTVYGTLTKMQRDGVITVYADERRKTIYEITSVGRKLILAEITRLKELYENGKMFEGEFDV